MNTTTYAEDKTCRICGMVDKKNVDLFEYRHKSLLYKILTIYPITLYESDPLPKNICKKCVINVQQMYDECQRLVKVQQKWVENVRTNKPDHPYVAVLDIIQECHQTMLARIKEVAPDFIFKNMRVMRPDFPMEDDAVHFNMKSATTTPVAEAEDQKMISPPPPAPKTISSLSFDYDPDSDPLASLKNSGFPFPVNERRSSIKEIQHKLKSNGCTLLVKPQQFDIKPRIHQSNVHLKVRCKCCRKRFPNVRFLAKHQLVHMTVTDRRIFDRKCLEKSIRRGRLIPMDDKKCIRCLNCWKLFPDNRKILEHWSKADCEFYCQICGLEFAKNPKQLREHVTEVHGITYKSSRRQTANIPDVRILNRAESEEVDVKPTLPIPGVEMPADEEDLGPPPPPLIRKPQDMKSKPIVRVCELCGISFPNYQSKNSHMRVHRPGFAASQAKRKSQNILLMDMPQLMAPNEIKTEKDEYPMPELQAAPILLTALAADPVAQTPVLLAAIPPAVEEDDEPPIKKEKLDDEIEATLKAATPTRITTTMKKMIMPKKPPPKVYPGFKRAHIGKPSLLLPPPPAAAAVAAAPQNKIRNVQVPAGSISVTGAVAKKSDQDQMQYDKLYNCHPCGKKFSSKNDLFQHKRQCQSNNKFGCRFCLRAFVTSADLQMHIMLMHKEN